eukprot:48991-Amphidinium_carterae.1
MTSKRGRGCVSDKLWCTRSAVRGTTGREITGGAYNRTVSHQCLPSFQSIGGIPAKIVSVLALSRAPSLFDM